MKRVEDEVGKGQREEAKRDTEREGRMRGRDRQTEKRQREGESQPN